MNLWITIYVVNITSNQILNMITNHRHQLVTMMMRKLKVIDEKQMKI